MLLNLGPPILGIHGECLLDDDVMGKMKSRGIHGRGMPLGRRFHEECIGNPWGEAFGMTILWGMHWESMGNVSVFSMKTRSVAFGE
jgi:hypothetical protein